MPSHPRPDYGLDAPGVVRNLFVGSAVAWIISFGVLLGLWPDRITLPLGQDFLVIEYFWMGVGFGTSLGAGGFWMIWDSRIGKIRGRERFLSLVSWSGTEKVVDLGCGRGLLLAAAARRLTTGKASGIDIWQTQDLSGNDPEATLTNLKREGVEDRAEILTADMRSLPFADGSIDLVVSRAAIHNIPTAEGRAQAIREVARVLKPGGRALIADIRHGEAYAQTFRDCGCAEVKVRGTLVGRFLSSLATFGSLQPSTLLVTR